MYFDICSSIRSCLDGLQACHGIMRAIHQLTDMKHWVYPLGCLGALRCRRLLLRCVWGRSLTM